jgi:hypothetical protein
MKTDVIAYLPKYVVPPNIVVVHDTGDISVVIFL